MQSLYLLIPVAILFVVLAVRFLFWAIKSGQYDDLNTEGHRILFDDDIADRSRAKSTTKPVSDADENASPKS